MFARVTRLQIRPGQLDEFLRIFQDSIAPASAAQPGFGGMTLLTDAQSNQAVAIALWETSRDIVIGEANDAEQLVHFGHLLAAPVHRDSYDVSLQVELSPVGALHIRGI
jgi:heme-degrading monooxygenase HmoA